MSQEKDTLTVSGDEVVTDEGVTITIKIGLPPSDFTDLVKEHAGGLRGIAVKELGNVLMRLARQSGLAVGDAELLS